MEMRGGIEEASERDRGKWYKWVYISCIEAVISGQK
jgi:hypothetical protein